MQPANTKSSIQYRQQLDSLRAFAVLAVLIHHFYPESEAFGLGYYGVRLFFVLSGFLITGLLLDSRNYIERTEQGYALTFRQFYLRRTLRIVPVYYLALALALLLGNTDVSSGAWWYATYTSNFFFIDIDFYPLTTAHLWSLAVEAQFYLIWPFIVLLVKRQHLLPSIIVLILVGPIYRFFAILGSYGFVEFYTYTLSSLDSLGWGGLLAWMHHNTIEAPWFRRVGLGLFLLIPILSPIFMEDTYFYVIDNTFLSIAFLWLIAGATKGFRGFVGKIMNSNTLIYLGKISYGMYVYHLFVPWGLYEVWGLPQPENEVWNFMLLMGATVSLASLSWRVFEKPIHDLKRYIPNPSLPPNIHHGLTPAS